MANQFHITVMAGGPGAEREISLRSGVAVQRALRASGYCVTEIDPFEKDWKLPPDTKVVFLALHGEYGEDGQVQSRLETLSVPYTGTGPEGSRVAFDKELTKQVFEQNKIPTPRWIMLANTEALPPTDLGESWVLKPPRQGSSVGLQIVDAPDQWHEALAIAGDYGGPVLCEELIRGREITVGILDKVALPIVEVRPKEGPYDYHNKYTVGATDYFCPADLPADTANRISEISLQSFEAVGASEFGRVDLMLDETLNPYVLEVNTLPGLTETSLLPKAAAAAGLGFPALCGRMVDLAVQNHVG
ncbi:MAG: D-alanine--D-alanine ligase [Verrucomicrobiota bacterium]|nr:D-alanine--D-alanine ligase [Verrucomicrobiota bacterium]